MESQGDCFQAVEEAPNENKGHLGVPEAENEKPPESTETSQVKAVVKIFEDFVVKKDGGENLSSKKTGKEVKSLGVEFNKVDEIMTGGSKAVGNNKISDVKVMGAENGYENAAKAMVNYQTMGSMRKQNEWKRTLACKLFEERHSHNVDGTGEGMDLLWETYETDSKVEMKGKKSGGGNNNGGYYYDNDDYEEEESNGQLCCLQALKLSAGKMNLGMGRPNLVRISKALKGIGWLHHVGSRHGKKKGHH
ncbi:putative DNA binding protein [Hibiscus syriacus]|uniref:DNA binding protein n=1 Tax=Hibiscus syriacus TaxID=106335 RepID=A0A6A3A8S2_HIBSY|nr:putative DNA binding protein [Hibiscus syriacus]